MTVKKRFIGKTNVEVSELGFGTAPLGGWPVEVSDKNAQSSLQKAWDLGIRYFDTAPLYGSGMSEIRLGNFLKNQNRNEFTISTKVGRLIVDTTKSKASEKFIGSPIDKDSEFNFSYDATMKSLEDSLQRLDLNEIDILYLHDPDNHPDHFQDARDGAIKAMIKLRDEGVVKAIGCGMNQNEMLIEFAKEGCFDCFLLAGRYTLLDQTSLDQLIPVCEKNNITLVLGGVFNSGILIDPSPETYFDYSKLDNHWVRNVTESLVRKPKDHESAEYWLQKAYNLRHACEKFSLQLKQAAIRFPYGNSIVSSCLFGMTSPKQVNENFQLYNSKIDKLFWEYLKEKNLIRKEVITHKN